MHRPSAPSGASASRGHMKPSRRTQPHRKGGRAPGSALSAMLAGKPKFMVNPMDAKRRMQKKRRGR